MKYFFIIALLCASFVSFSQTPLDTRKAPKVCGYNTEYGAESGSMLAAHQNTFNNPDETFQSCSITYENGSYCYQNTYTCHNTLNIKQKEGRNIVLETGCKNDSPPIVSK